LAHYDLGLGVTVLDLADPMLPTPRAQLAVNGYTQGLCRVKNLLFVAAGFDGIYLFDLTQSTSFPVQHYLTPGHSAFQLTSSGKHLFVAEGSAGLEILEVSDEMEFRKIGIYGEGEDIQRISINGSLAYVGNGTRGLDIVDISNPTNPVRISRYDTDFPQSATLYANVGVLTGANSLQIVDLAEPSKPVFMRSIKTSGPPVQATIYDDMVFVTEGYAGLEIFGLDYILAPSLDIEFQSSPARLLILKMRGAVGRKFVVESASELTSENGWKEVSQVVLRESPQIIQQMEPESVPTSYYRARIGE
jgi:hypothetical protein